MADELSGTVALNAAGTSWIFTDTRGAYDATTNTNGYGGPNVAVAEYTSYVISVVPPDSSTLLATGTAVPINAYPSLPSSSNGTFELTSLAILGSADTVLSDGWWQFNVTAQWDNGDTGEYTLSINVINYKTIKCCIDNLIIKYKGKCSEADKDTLTKAILYLNQVIPGPDGAESPTENCDQYTSAAEKLVELQEICEDENCGCC